MGRNIFTTIFANTILFTFCLTTFEKIESEATSLPASQNVDLNEPDVPVIHNYYNHNHRHYFFTLALDKALLSPENETTVDVLPTIYTGGAKELKCEDTSYKTERGSDDDNYKPEKETRLFNLRKIQPGNNKVADDRVKGIPEDRKYFDFIVGDTGDTNGRPQIQQSSGEHKVKFMNSYDSSESESKGKLKGKHHRGKAIFNQDRQFNDDIDDDIVRSNVGGKTRCDGDDVRLNEEFDAAENEDGVSTAQAKPSVNGRVRINNDRNTYANEYNNNGHVQYGEENIKGQYVNEHQHYSDVYGVGTDGERANLRGRLDAGKEDRYTDGVKGAVENEGGAMGHKYREHAIVRGRVQTKPRPRPDNRYIVHDGNDEQTNAERPWMEDSIKGRGIDRASDNFGYVDDNVAVGGNVRQFGRPNDDMVDSKRSSRVYGRGSIKNGGDVFRGESILVGGNKRPYGMRNGDLDDTKVKSICQQTGGTIMKGGDGFRGETVVGDENEGTYGIRNEYLDGPGRSVTLDTVRKGGDAYGDRREGAVDNRNIYQDVVNTARRVTPVTVRKGVYYALRDRSEGAVDRNIDQDVNTASGVREQEEAAANGDIADNINGDATLGREENLPPNNELLSVDDEGKVSSGLLRDPHTSSMAGSRYPNGKQDLLTEPGTLSTRPPHFSTVDTGSYIGSGNDNQNPDSRPQKSTDEVQHEEGVAYGLGNYDDLGNPNKQRVTDVIYDGQKKYGNVIDQASLNAHNMPYEGPPKGSLREDQSYQTELTGAPIEKPKLTMWPCIRLQNSLIPVYKQVPCTIASSQCAQVILS